MVGVGVVATFVGPMVWLLSNMEGEIFDRFVKKCEARIKAYSEDPTQPFFAKIIAGFIVVPILLIVVMFETAIQVIFETWWLNGIVSIAQVVSFRYFPLWPDTMRFLGVVAVLLLVGLGLGLTGRRKGNIKTRQDKTRQRLDKDKTKTRQIKNDKDKTKSRKLIRS